MLKSKIILLFITAACSFAACKTDPAYDQATQAAIDDGLIRKFIADKNIPAKKTPEGLYYQIIKDGAGNAKYDSLDVVMMRFVGRTITPDTMLYDSTQTLIDTLAPTFTFSSAIKGWRIGLKLIQPGGQIRLIVPSTLAYQNQVIAAAPGPNNTQRFLPPNTILDFRIKLIRVTKPVPPTIVQPN